MKQYYQFFYDYFSLVFDAKCQKIHGEGIKILTPKQMLQRLSIVLAPEKAVDISEKLLYGIRHIL